MVPSISCLIQSYRLDKNLRHIRPTQKGRMEMPCSSSGERGRCRQTIHTNPGHKRDDHQVSSEDTTPHSEFELKSSEFQHFFFSNEMEL